MTNRAVKGDRAVKGSPPVVRGFGHIWRQGPHLVREPKIRRRLCLGGNQWELQRGKGTYDKTFYAERERQKEITRERAWGR